MEIHDHINFASDISDRSPLCLGGWLQLAVMKRHMFVLLVFIHMLFEGGHSCSVQARWLEYNTLIDMQDWGISRTLSISTSHNWLSPTIEMFINSAGTSAYEKIQTIHSYQWLTLHNDVVICRYQWCTAINLTWLLWREYIACRAISLWFFKLCASTISQILHNLYSGWSGNNCLAASALHLWGGSDISGHWEISPDQKCTILARGYFTGNITSAGCSVDCVPW